MYVCMYKRVESKREKLVGVEDGVGGVVVGTGRETGAVTGRGARRCSVVMSHPNED